MDVNNFEYTIQDHLRPPERLKYVLPAQVVKNGPDADKVSSKSNPGCLLAIITNMDYDEEEGRYGVRSITSINVLTVELLLFSIFVFRLSNQASAASEQQELELQSIFPLTNILTISVAQGRSRSGTIDLRKGKQAPAPPQSKSF